MTPIYTDPESRLRGFLIVIRDNPRSSVFTKTMATLALTEPSISALYGEELSSKKHDESSVINLHDSIEYIARYIEPERGSPAHNIALWIKYPSGETLLVSRHTGLSSAIAEAKGYPITIFPPTTSSEAVQE